MDVANEAREYCKISKSMASVKFFTYTKYVGAYTIYDHRDTP